MISLLHPSRGRPYRSFTNMMNWYHKSIDPFDIETIISIDLDDPKEKNYERHVTETGALKIMSRARNNRSVVDATNAAADESKGEILVYLSDDFDCPDGWDKLILKEFEGVTEPMLLKVDDCLQRFDAGVVTIPIMNRELYDKLGYFWHPDYKSMHVDVDLFETCKKIGAIKYAPHLKFPHNHYSNGKAAHDETYKRSEGNWDQGLQVLKRRRAQGFPI